ncbi:hypothetical protein FZW96_15085 [Bacillus sp. BGMRC 2118]|nr:hypothetical protein FZW96_15085 [Bacillus sp. BGMRC 2118]
MGIRNNNKCCCTCEEMFQDFVEGETVFVDVVAGPGGSRTIRGTLEELGEDSVVIEEQNNRRTRVCCAYIVSVSDMEQGPPTPVA